MKYTLYPSRAKFAAYVLSETLSHWVFPNATSYQARIAWRRMRMEGPSFPLIEAS